MAELKTRKTNASVKKFLDGIGDEGKRMDSRVVVDLMKEITKEKPKMWGPSIVGFGDAHYKYDSGREGDWFLTGFSPRKQSLTLYITSGFSRYEALLKKLGRFTTGKSCLYIKTLEDVDLKTLRQLISQSVKHMKKKSA